MSLLDRSRDFGTVFGLGVPHRYEQDGKKFDHLGREVDDKGRLVDPMAAPETTPKEGRIGRPRVDADGSGYLTRNEIMRELDRRGVKYHPRARHSDLMEILLNSPPPEDDEHYGTEEV